jgi:MFS family permease
MRTGKIRIADYGRLLRTNRNFRLLWSAQIVSELGDWFYSVAIFSFLLQVAGTAQSVAFAFVLQVLPQFFAAPTAGVINDRISRKKTMIFADWMRAGIVLSMLLVRSRDMVWLLYLLLFSETIMWALFEPARSAVVPNIAGGSDRVIANALSSTTWSFNFAVGSALGGFVAAMFGREAVFIINSMSFVASALLIRRMRFDEPHAAHLPPLCPRDLVDFKPITEGVRYVMRDARIFATLFVKAGLSLMGTNWVLIPLMGERLFPVHIEGFRGPQAATMGMSVMLASRGVGAILGAFISTWIVGASAVRQRMAIIGGFLLGAAGYAILSRAPSIWVACAGLIVAHSGGSVIWVASTTLLQNQTDDRFRGRVFSAEFAFTTLTLAVTSQAAGVLIDRGAGLRTVALATGVILLVPMLAWTYAQQLWRSDVQPDVSQPGSTDQRPFV